MKGIVSQSQAFALGSKPVKGSTDTAGAFSFSKLLSFGHCGPRPSSVGGNSDSRLSVEIRQKNPKTG